MKRVGFVLKIKRLLLAAAGVSLPACCGGGPAPLPILPVARALAAELGRARRQTPDLRSDPQRPVYHFLPPSGWMNDPNGLIQWQGLYHLFYQHNPRLPAWGLIHWGHAVSRDLVHWEPRPIALSPQPGEVDELGCWSGCALEYNGMPAVIYSGNRNMQQRACLALSTDDLHTLRRFAGNPLIPSPPPGLKLSAYRDHCVWRQGGEWRMLMGGGIHKQGGAVFLYRSKDLLKWEYLGPALTGEAWPESGTVWECPDLIPLGVKQALVISLHRGKPSATAYFLGAWEGERFIPESFHTLDGGGFEYYAPLSFQNTAGERIQFGWVNEARRQDLVLRSGWAGVLSLPRRLSLGASGLLEAEPHPALECLRTGSARLGSLTIPDGQAVDAPLGGPALELHAVFKPGGQAARFGLKICRSPGGEEETLLFYDQAAQSLELQRQHSSLERRCLRTPRTVSLVLGEGEGLDLRVFIDHSLVEVFANRRALLTCRLYPQRPDSAGVQVFAVGGPAELDYLEMWPMREINGGEIDS